MCHMHTSYDLRSPIEFRYDGEDEQPSQPVKAEPKQEVLTPEPVPKQEEQLYSPEPEEDVNFTTEANTSSEGMQGMQVTKQEHDDEYDRPIGIKEDGYV